MISTGNKELDSFLDGYGKEVTLIYGPAATGKTTLCLLCCSRMLKDNKKVVYLDTENGFSVERFIQICGAGYITMLDRLLVLQAQNFQDQCDRIDSIINIVGVDLVIVDSLGKHYRKYVVENHSEANKKLDRQLRILTEISRKGIPVVVTNHVSSNPETKEIRMVGGDMVKQWGKKVVRLEKEQRRVLFLERPEERSIDFEIVQDGIRIVS